MEIKKIWISYLEENGNTFSGYLDLIELNTSYVRLQTKTNIITIPINRVLKIKEHREE